MPCLKHEPRPSYTHSVLREACVHRISTCVPGCASELTSGVRRADHAVRRPCNETAPSSCCRRSTSASEPRLQCCECHRAQQSRQACEQAGSLNVMLSVSEVLWLWACAQPARDEKLAGRRRAPVSRRSTSTTTCRLHRARIRPPYFFARSDFAAQRKNTKLQMNGTRIPSQTCRCSSPHPRDMIDLPASAAQVVGSPSAIW